LRSRWRAQSARAAYAFAPAALGIIGEHSAAAAAPLYVAAGSLQLLAAAIYLIQPRMTDA
jgi:hypothetical protein